LLGRDMKITSFPRSPFSSLGKPSPFIPVIPRPTLLMRGWWGQDLGGEESLQGRWATGLSIKCHSEGGTYRSTPYWTPPLGNFHWGFC
jgi:predicted CxxxxCH...CXXCH cytochrome family protein